MTAEIKARKKVKGKRQEAREVQSSGSSPSLLLHPSAQRELLAMIAGARTPRLRTMREFAEVEVIIPDGPYAGSRFTCKKQPYTGLFFDAVDTGLFDKINATGPTQSGKTLTCCIIPLLYHLFEIGETVVMGIPDMKMANDKWREDILPVIRRTRFDAMRPTRGPGSRGGSVKESVTFTNGATLRFMSGGGDDKVRAGFTTRVLVITETDGMDEPGLSSRESTKIKQLFARTRAFSDATGRRARIYTECTVSTAEGYTWYTHLNSTHSRIALPCPRCGDMVSPEREHLLGWQAAANKAEAAAGGRFVCPECGGDWTDEERVNANLAGVLIHEEGTRQEEGNSEEGDGRFLTGAALSDTLGFRWSAVNNLFTSAAAIAAEEWAARREVDPEQGDREMCQFVWSIPPAAMGFESTPLKPDEVRERFGDEKNSQKKGVLPAGTHCITVGLDTHKRFCIWVAIAWTKGGAGRIIDYGEFAVDSDRLGVLRAIIEALTAFAKLITAGWVNAVGGRRGPDQVLIDSGWHEHTEAVYAFCRQMAQADQRTQATARWRPSKGYGTGHKWMRRYAPPKQTNKEVVLIGEAYHLTRLPASRIVLVHVNSDYWKSWLHQRLAAPIGEPAAMTLYTAMPGEHEELAWQLTAERQVEKYVPEVGDAIVWERIRRANHYLDAAYSACAAGHMCGVRLVEGEEVPATPRRRQPRAVMTMPDGRPFV